MADGTKIEWTDATWNPVTGCSVVSPGCTNCYAMKLAGTRLRNHPSRKGLTRDTKAGPVWTGEMRLNTEWLDQPIRWTKPRRIFVCAHGDLFAEGVPDGWIMQVLTVMAQCPHHTFQVLTKRPDRMRDFFKRWADLSGEDFGDFKDARGPAEVRANHPSPRGQLFADMLESMGAPPAGAAYPPFDWSGGMMFWPDTFRHIWLGTSVEDQPRADERISILLDTPAALHWISAEPLIGSMDLRRILIDHPSYHGVKAHLDALTGQIYDLGDTPIGEVANRLKWVVVGGESGPGARPMHPAWARSARDQCAAAGVAFNFKQHGAWAPVDHMTSEEIDECYRSRRKAKPGEDQAAIDESYGRDCIVDLTILHGDGRRYDLLSPLAFADRQAMTMMHVGKKAAGRRLDGIEHNGFPEVRR